MKSTLLKLLPRPLYLLLKAVHLRVLNKRSQMRRALRETAISGDEFARNFREAQHRFHDDPSVMTKFLKSHSLHDFWLYFVDSQNAPHYRMQWGERMMSKFPMDTWVYKHLIETSKPNLIIEIGTQRGNSAIMLRELSRHLDTAVVTFDILTPDDSVIKTFDDHGITFFNTDATTAKAVDDILSLGIEADDIRALIIDDGSHKEDHVIETFALLKRFVPKGGYFIIEDGFTNELMDKKGFLAMQGVRHILDHHDDFHLERGFDDFFMMSAYMGILKKSGKAPAQQ